MTDDEEDRTPTTASTQLITPLTSDKILEVDVHTPTVSHISVFGVM
jgi:hypothetical protein